ncbi:MAG: glucosaminidase domain-containing protein, partial [Muribaculaceae bacterium]|nr:glucosaminidase domain-containing protein [Muribaculaceae bacterium]
FSGILVAGLMVVTGVFGAEAQTATAQSQVEAQDIPVYESLDEAIEAELEGVDFSDMEGVDDFSICSRSKASAEQLTAFVRRHNKRFDDEIAKAYLAVGDRYGVRGDIAFCQAILETGWFRFDRGTKVNESQHNYCGLGVVGNGVKGAAFETIEDGVTAHIQHLYAYATTGALPEGERMVDPRFGAVKRGVARDWSDLNNRWAMNSVYGSMILKIYSDLLKINVCNALK